jgi:hypothetical protein
VTTRRRAWPGWTDAVLPAAAIALALVLAVVTAVAVASVAAHGAGRGRRVRLGSPPPPIVLVSIVAGPASVGRGAGLDAAPPGSPSPFSRAFVLDGGTRRRENRGAAAPGPTVGPDDMRSDRAVLEQALSALADRGVAHGPVRPVTLVEPDLARVLVETTEARDPCRASARWRLLMDRSATDGAAVVVVAGGTIRGLLPFVRRAGLTCPGTGATSPVVLLDRRPVPGVAPVVVLLHELGHAAGLGHPSGAPGAAGAMLDLMAVGASAPPDERAVITLGDVAVPCGEVGALARLLESGAGGPVGRVSAHGRCRSPPADQPPRRGGAPAP